jgi:hypothetical protein
LSVCDSGALAITPAGGRDLSETLGLSPQLSPHRKKNADLF